MINASFKVYWNNPIGLTTESSSEQLQFNIPLGAIIADPSVATDLSNYYTKPETDLQITNAVTSKVDSSVFTQAMTLKADLVNGKVPSSQLPDITGLTLGETSETAYRGDRGKVAYDHSQSQGNPHNSTTSDITEGSRLYFTDARVRTTSLTGLSTATGGAISATDTVLGALGKIQNQVTNSGGGSSSPVWVNITTVGTIPAYVTNADIQVARFQGMLWIKGTFNVNTNVAGNSELFRITAQAYKPYSYSTAGTARLLMLLSTWGSIPNSTRQVGITALGNITNSSQASTVDVIFEVKGSSISTSDGTMNIPPTIIGTLAN